MAQPPLLREEGDYVLPSNVLSNSPVSRENRKNERTKAPQVKAVRNKRLSRLPALLFFPLSFPRLTPGESEMSPLRGSMRMRFARLLLA
jgi:hypothetical protein